MDFDEYEYLENTVENPEAKKLEGKANGGDGGVEYEEKERSRGSKRRSTDDDGDNLDHPSKSSRSRNEVHDREKDRGARHGSSARDRDRGERDRERGDRDRERSDRDRERGDRDRERGEKDRHAGSRDRTRDKDESSGKERNRDRDRDRERDSDKKRNGTRERRERDNEKDRIKEEEPERPKRSRSRSERHHEEREREKSKEIENVEPDFKDRLRERGFRNQDRDNRRYNKDKKEDKVEPEVDPERDQRTVFAYQITLKAGERDIYEFFSRAGKVRDVRLIMDRNTRRSKGVGYIEFYDSMSVPMAIALSGQPLLGLPVMVKPSEAEKNLVQSTTAASGGLLGPYSGGARRLYVGNLPLTIKEEQLRQVFEPFGIVELVQMPSDPGTGNCKGYAFIQFARLEDAKAAQNLNGQLEIAGRVIKVSAITDQAGMQEAGVNLADLDDDEGNGLSLNAQSRALLMQKLDRTGTASSYGGVSTASVLGQTSGQMLPGITAAGFSMPALTVPPMDTIGVPSECLLLKNMFDPSLETEPDFDLDIKEDVQNECLKFGRLKHIHIEKNSAGFVYLRFENAQSAIAAQSALHGRWFAGKMITAIFMVHSDYEAKFPESSS